MSPWWRALLTALTMAATLAAFAPAVAATPDDSPRRGPIFIAIEPESGKILALCEKSGTIARVDPRTGEIEAEARAGESPFAVARHPGEPRLYVSCRRGQEVVEVDGRTLEVLRRFPLRGDPTGVEVSADGRRLYTALHSLDEVAVLDIEKGVEIARLRAGNGPEFLKRSPADGCIYVTNLLTSPVPPGRPSRDEITVIDDATIRVAERIVLAGANVGRQIAFTDPGDWAIVAISRPKNLIPMTQVARGWVVTNGFALLAPGTGLPPFQLLVDLPNRAFADLHAVAITPDDRKIYISSAGADTVLAIDRRKLERVIDEVLAGAIPRYSDHLGLSRRHVTARIPVGANPMALATSTDGRRLYVANRLDDTISVIDTRTDRVARTLTLGEPPPPDRRLRGERLFYSAGRTFQRQFSCVSCHPDNGLDGLQYDLEPDGIGRNILDNRNLRGIAGTAPFKWAGSNPDIPSQCGARTAKWVARTGWLGPRDIVALAEFVRSIPPVENPYLAPDGALTPAQKRGRELFERAVTNDGKPISVRNRCGSCHSGPDFSNHQRFDVGTGTSRDTSPEFDTAHLTNIFESGPYLHDGRAATLGEIWSLHNRDDMHGVSSDWTEAQLHDMVEFLQAIGPGMRRR